VVSGECEIEQGNGERVRLRVGDDQSPHALANSRVAHSQCFPARAGPLT
jgi:hypothetical protein